MATNDTSNILGVSVKQYSDATRFTDGSGKPLDDDSLNLIEHALRSILGCGDQTGYLDEIISSANTALSDEISARTNEIRDVQREVDALETAVEDRYTKTEANALFVNESRTYDFCGGSANALHNS